MGRSDPYEEVRAEFRKILKGRNVNWKWIELIGRSQKLLEDTVAGNYPAVLKDYGGEIVTVGINYDAKTKEHSCMIERVHSGA